MDISSREQVLKSEAFIDSVKALIAEARADGLLNGNVLNCIESIKLMALLDLAGEPFKVSYGSNGETFTKITIEKRPKNPTKDIEPTLN